MIAFRPYQRDDRTWVAQANLQFYRAFHGFDATFADAVGAALDLLDSQISETASIYLIAEAAGRPVGCIFLSPETPAIGRIRLFYLEKDYRGQGIGKRLLRAVLTGAGKTAFNTLRVSTFDRHPEACLLYESAGFRPVRTVRSRAFGQVMQQVDYELQLRAPLRSHER